VLLHLVATTAVNWPVSVEAHSLVAPYPHPLKFLPPIADQYSAPADSESSFAIANSRPLVRPPPAHFPPFALMFRF